MRSSARRSILDLADVDVVWLRQEPALRHGLHHHDASARPAEGDHAGGERPVWVRNSTGKDAQASNFPDLTTAARPSRAIPSPCVREFKALARRTHSETALYRQRRPRGRARGFPPLPESDRNPQLAHELSAAINNEPRIGRSSCPAGRRGGLSASSSSTASRWATDSVTPRGETRSNPAGAAAPKRSGDRAQKHRV